MLKTVLEWCTVNAQKLLFVAFLAAAAFLIYLPTDLASTLAVPPDSFEYSFSLGDLFENGRFGLMLNGEWFPSRYAPWFPLTCLSPAYLFGGNALCCHFPVLAFSLAVLCLTYYCGRKIGLGWWSLLPPLMIVLMPKFVFFSRVAMTEVPYAAVLLATAVLFVDYVQDSDRRRVWYLFAGLMLAWCGMIRFTGLFMTLPFLAVGYATRRSFRQFVFDSLLLGIPVALYLVANAVYCYSVFGSPFRNGYHYWTPVPSEFLSLTFSWSYIGNALAVYFVNPFTLVVLMLFAVSLIYFLLILKGKFGEVSHHKVFLAYFIYGTVQLLVLGAFYICYYFLDARFFISMMVYFLPLAVYSLREILRQYCKRYALAVLTVLLLGLGYKIWDCPPRYVYQMVQQANFACEARLSSEVLPENSVVVSDGDPAVFECFGYGSRGLKHVPLTRKFVYAGFMIAPKPFGGMVPRPDDWYPMIVPEFVQGGFCRQPFEYSFLEKPEMIRRLLEKGVRVFYPARSWYEDLKAAKFDRDLSSNGMKRVSYGKWSVEPVASNPFRHWYDEFLFQEYSMDVRPGFEVEYFELVLDD